MRKIVAVPIILAALTTLEAAALEGGDRSLVEARESLYNNIYVYQQGPYVSMTFGYNRAIYTESVFNKDDELDLPVSYTRYMTLSLAYKKDIKSVLEIGFGGGRTSWYLHRHLPDVSVTSVELDPAVVDLAHKYFGIKNEKNFNVANRDGRIFLADSHERYDLILIDAYRGPFVPFHLLTKEFYKIVKEHLSEGGVVVQNIEPSTMLFDSAVKTIYEVFPHLDFYPAEGNVVTVAYDGVPLQLADLQRQATEHQDLFHFRYNLPLMLAKRRIFRPGASDIISPKATVLTDDFAPVESLKAIEQHNRKW
jgi:spermidine synthase